MWGPSLGEASPGLACGHIPQSAQSLLELTAGSRLKRAEHSPPPLLPAVPVPLTVTLTVMPQPLPLPVGLLSLGPCRGLGKATSHPAGPLVSALLSPVPRGPASLWRGRGCGLGGWRPLSHATTGWCWCPGRAGHFSCLLSAFVQKGREGVKGLHPQLFRAQGHSGENTGAPARPPPLQWSLPMSCIAKAGVPGGSISTTVARCRDGLSWPKRKDIY